MAADGVATRVIAREVNCAIGTAAKWRVRYAKDRTIEESAVASIILDHAIDFALQANPVRIEVSEGTGSKGRQRNDDEPC